MAKLKVYISIGLVGCKKTEIIEIPDSDMPEEIGPEFDREIFSMMADMGMYEWGYEVLDA